MSNKVQHTPGPWYLSGEQPFNQAQHVCPTTVVDSNGYQICDFPLGGTRILQNWGERPGAQHWSVDRGGTVEVSDEENEANALLAAAAPDLLAEMQRYLPILERLEQMAPGWWAECTKGTGVATLNGYRAAISKALGQ